MIHIKVLLFCLGILTTSKISYAEKKIDRNESVFLFSMGDLAIEFKYLILSKTEKWNGIRLRSQNNVIIVSEEDVTVIENKYKTDMSLSYYRMKRKGEWPYADFIFTGINEIQPGTYKYARKVKDECAKMGKRTKMKEDFYRQEGRVINPDPFCHHHVKEFELGSHKIKLESVFRETGQYFDHYTSTLTIDGKSYSLKKSILADIEFITDFDKDGHPEILYSHFAEKESDDDPDRKRFVLMTVKNGEAMVIYEGINGY